MDSQVHSIGFETLIRLKSEIPRFLESLIKEMDLYYDS
jgi:hypothetical protein